jgi:hypothetical protein
MVSKPVIPADKNCPLPPFCGLSHSWFHPLQNKAHCSLSLTTFLCPPLDLASAAGLIPCRTKPHYPLSPATSLCPSLALLSPKCYLRPDPPRTNAAPFFLLGQPDCLLNFGHEKPLVSLLCVRCVAFS